MNQYSTQPSPQTEEIAALREQVNAQRLKIAKLEQELAQAQLVRSSFLNNIGHEMRTPLSVILGYADILLQEAQQVENEGIITLVQKIKLYTKNFSATVNDVLQMSELESGQVGFLLEAFGIETVIKQAIRQSQTELDIYENDLLLMVPPDIGFMIADRDKVRVILVNLLINAAKFTKNGTITVSARRTQIADQDWIVFEVTDTGIGIASEKQSQIFQPFFQGDNSSTKKHEGLGLGLAIIQHYCDMMGGRIAFESTLGEGSTFVVTLPAEITAVSSMFVRSSAPTKDYGDL
jgi:signal transduction histidine kinase